MELRIHVEPLPEGMWIDADRTEAFGEVYRRCQPELVDLCRRVLCGRGDPEAVAQEAFVRAWRSIERFSGIKPFWPWLATIARRLCIDHLRRMGREASKLQVEASLCDSQAIAGPDELFEESEDCRVAILALKRLKPAEQRVITLREVNGWSYDEIAEFEGVTVESVRGSLKRARIRLRESYAKVAAGAPAALAPLRRLRLRLERAVAGAPGVTPAAPVAMGLAGDAATRAVALILGIASLGGSVHVPAHDPATSSAPTVATLVTGAPTSRGGSEAGTSGGPSSHDRAPADGGNGSSAPLLVGARPPSDGGDTPEDVAFGTVTPSPAYASDGTLFATGVVMQGCVYLTCPVVFRSTDRGRSWERLPGIGYGGGEVLLPAAYPSDPRIFATGADGLRVSDNGGVSFRLLAAIGGSAAISPAFSSGDPRILFAATPGWEYRDDVQATKPGGVVLPSTATTGTVAFAPAYPVDPRIVIGGTTVDGANRSASGVFLCEQGVCGTTTVLDGFTGAPSLAVSPSFAQDHTVLAWRATGLFASTDGARSFTRLAVPVAGQVQDVVFSRHGVLVVVRADHGVTLLWSADRGRSWEPFARGAKPAADIESFEVLPDGRMLATPTPAAGGGLRCSRDDGRTWAARC